MLQVPLERHSPHVVVVGNEKGGSGKTTIAMHIAVALLKLRFRVATVDLDSRQKSLTHYIDHRRDWAQRTGKELPVPDHFAVARAEGESMRQNEAAEFTAFQHAVATAEHNHDFVVIDTPPHDTFMMRLAHSIADTLVTPLNDSFIDLDVLATVDPITFAVTGVSHYAELVTAARRQRSSVDGVWFDWVVVRNRLSLASLVESAIADDLDQLGLSLGFRTATGLVERRIYREFFPRGLTALDVAETDMPPLDSEAAYTDARLEAEALLDALRLPVDERGRRRAAARAQWFAAQRGRLEADNLLAGA